jgi:hypothetical protein
LDEFRRSKVLQASAGAGFRLAALVESGQIWGSLAIWPGWGAKRAKKGKKAQRPIKSAINQQKGVVYKENTSIMLPCRNKPDTQKKGLHYE